jgi:hypothetical protein
MDIVTAVYAANKAKADLANSGQIGRTETEKHIIVPEVTFTKGFNFTSAGMTIEHIEEGGLYHVMWDGVEYSCVCKLDLGSTSSSTKSLYIGDYYTFTDGSKGDQATGEPFVYYEAIRNTGAIKGQVIAACADEGTHTASIYQKTETIHPIDPKFLPEGGVGYAETAQKVLADKSAVAFEYFSDLGGYFGAVFPNDGVDFNTLSFGDIILVHWDGKDYECVVANFNGIKFFGNLSVMDMGNNTGEPFLGTFEEYTDEGVTVIIANIIALDTSETHTVGIYQNAETVAQIDKKFIPPLDSLILNGTDGNQYKVTVVNGALAVEVV